MIVHIPHWLIMAAIYGVSGLVLVVFGVFLGIGLVSMSIMDGFKKIW